MLRARPAGLLRMPQSNKKRRAWARRFETKPRKRLAERRPAAVEASGRDDRRGAVEAAAIGGRRRPLRSRRGRERVGCCRCRGGGSRGLAWASAVRTDVSAGFGRIAPFAAAGAGLAARLRQAWSWRRPDLAASGLALVLAQADQPRHAVDRAVALLLGGLGFRGLGLRLRREQAAEEARGLGRRLWWRSSPVRQSPSAAAPPRRSDAQPARRRPRPARRRVPECAAAARSAEWSRAASRTRNESDGATPIWLRFTAATNTGCMPPSAPVLIGAAATLRRTSSANLASSRAASPARRSRSPRPPRRPGTWPAR